jgi:hypothetical protein
MQVSEEQIELLVRALKESGGNGRADLPYEMDEGEPIDFYRGLINGLVLGHQMLIDCAGDEQRLARLLSLGAAVASEQYLNLKTADEVLMSDEVTDLEN